MPESRAREIVRPERVCVICGGSLKGHRRDARCCSASCRAEQSRIRAILDGTYAGSYRSLAERLSKRKSSRSLAFPLSERLGIAQKRTQALSGRLPDTCRTRSRPLAPASAARTPERREAVSALSGHMLVHEAARAR
jgi:hypothetical protein